MSNLNQNPNAKKIKISIIGTGHLSQTISKLCQTNQLENVYDITIGSRSPQSMNLLYGVAIKSIEEAIQNTDIIILAFPALYFGQFVNKYKNLLVANAILIDPSNDDQNNDQLQKLQNQNQQLNFVKAFHDINCFEVLDDHFQQFTDKQVNIWGSSQKSLLLVKQFMKQMGLKVNISNDSSQILERLSQKNFVVFPNWIGPSKFMTATFTVTLAYASVRYNVYGSVKWQNFPLEVVNKAVCWTGLTGFAVTFGAGALMNLRQYFTGKKANTNEAKFHKKVLNRRKELGLLSLGCIGLHSILSLLIFSPVYYSKFFTNNQSKLNLMGEASMLSGITAFSFMLLGGLTSINSIAKTLGWYEWRFVQSSLGWLGLLLGTLHVTVLGSASWFNPQKWKANGGLPPITLLASIPPIIALILKLFTLIPPINRKIQKINKGIY